MGARRYTEEQFRAAVVDPQVRTIADLCRALGLVPSGGNYGSVRRYAQHLEVSLEPVRRGRGHLPMPALEDEAAVRQAVVASTSLAGAIRALGGQPSTHSYRALKGRIQSLGISTAHMAGQGWARRRSFPHRAKPLEHYLRRGGPVRISSTKLRRRLIADGVKEHECEQCRQRRWQGAAIPLELDHVNGDRSDNCLENLRLLCPNCHAQTPTYRGRNIGRYDGQRAEPG